VTREEKRREENKEPPLPPSASLNYYAKEILQAYPAGRRGRPGAAYKAIGEAIAAQQESQPWGDIDSVVSGLRAASAAFAKAVQGANQQYVPRAARWFEEKGYLQDPVEWACVGRDGPQKAPQDVEAAKAAERARDKQEAERRRTEAAEAAEVKAAVASVAKLSKRSIENWRQKVLAEMAPAVRRVNAGCDPRRAPMALFIHKAMQEGSR